MADEYLSQQPNVTSIGPTTRLVALNGNPEKNANVPESVLSTYVKTQAPYGTTRQHIGITAIGDSLTADGRVQRKGWLYRLCFLSHQRLRFRGENAVGGQTAQQAESTQLSGVLAMDPPPRLCVIAVGSNNFQDNTAVDDGIAAVKRMCAALDSVGIKPVLWTVPPRGDLPGSEATLTRWNYKIQMLRNQTGYPMIDANAALQDPTGWKIFPVKASYDLTHLTAHGCGLLAAYALKDPKFAGALQEADGVTALTTYDNDPYNVFPGGLFATDSGTAGAAAGVNPGPDGICTLVANDPDIRGRWQRVARLSSAGESSPATIGAMDVTPGEILDITVRVKLKATSTPTTLPDGSWNNMLALYYANSSWGGVTTEFLMATNGLDEEDGTIILSVVVPENAAHLQVLLGNSNITDIDSEIWVQIAQLTIRRHIIV
ncbi:hypothetical protein PJWF_00038 [Achromobacter phage JWF]|uniref:hypothetical protein n=1 Tax=Achromobacter phage JWF TaxID=1589748 RepID=UPI000588E56F|nr:hypothetical protein AXJ13_gp038 [Achromobacter phage JWF]AJD82932.1 hypothetical protein PJWF_00038 [Achromobacter phage JWF]